MMVCDCMLDAGLEEASENDISLIGSSLLSSSFDAKTGVNVFDDKSSAMEDSAGLSVSSKLCSGIKGRAALVVGTCSEFGVVDEGLALVTIVVVDSGDFMGMNPFNRVLLLTNTWSAPELATMFAIDFFLMAAQYGGCVSFVPVVLSSSDSNAGLLDLSDLSASFADAWVGFLSLMFAVPLSLVLFVVPVVFVVFWLDVDSPPLVFCCPDGVNMQLTLVGFATFGLS